VRRSIRLQCFFLCKAVIFFTRRLPFYIFSGVENPLLLCFEIVQMSLKGSLRTISRAAPVGGAPARGFATEKQIALRIVATSNLQKVSFLFSC
jgi:hypothetical protein